MRLQKWLRVPEMVGVGAHALGASRRARRHSAFTLIEMTAAMVVISALTGIALPRLHRVLEQAKIVQAVGEIQTMLTEIGNLEDLPTSLAAIKRASFRDPWGNLYVYYKFPPDPLNGNAPPAGARRDRFLVPVNSKFDLYSIGKDGKTAVAFTANDARDDVVCASDGAYVGLASKF